jgi:RNA polymerase sigma factor (sigma-70 family)
MVKKEKERDKYWSEEDPKNDIDFIEVSVDNESFDEFIKQHAPNYYLEPDPKASIHDRKRKKKMLHIAFRAAAKELTNRQLEIFVMRYCLGLQETVIAKQLDCNQSYISNVLKVCAKKIQKSLRLYQKPVISPEDTPAT